MLQLSMIMCHDNISTMTCQFCDQSSVTSSMTSFVKIYLCQYLMTEVKLRNQIWHMSRSGQGQPLDKATCARASRRTRTGASNLKNAPIDLGFCLHTFQDIWRIFGARAYARTRFAIEFRHFFDGFEYLTEFYIISNLFQTNWTWNKAYAPENVKTHARAHRLNVHFKISHKPLE